MYQKWFLSFGFSLNRKIVPNCHQIIPCSLVVLNARNLIAPIKATYSKISNRFEVVEKVSRSTEKLTPQNLSANLAPQNKSPKVSMPNGVSFTRFKANSQPSRRAVTFTSDIIASAFSSQRLDTSSSFLPVLRHLTRFTLSANDFKSGRSTSARPGASPARFHFCVIGVMSEGI